MLSRDNLNKIEELKKRFPDKKSLTIPVLWIAQEQYGWISGDTVREVADLLDLSPVDVHGVASFYTMFNKKPVGKYHIQVCTNVSCSLLGAGRLVDYLCKKLDIRVGETTPEGRFTLTEVECLGSCGTAPAVQINDEYYENLTPEKLDRIISELKQG